MLNEADILDDECTRFCHLTSTVNQYFYTAVTVHMIAKYYT